MIFAWIVSRGWRAGLIGCARVGKARLDARTTGNAELVATMPVATTRRYAAPEARKSRVGLALLSRGVRAGQTGTVRNAGSILANEVLGTGSEAGFRSNVT